MREREESMEIVNGKLQETTMLSPISLCLSLSLILAQTEYKCVHQKQRIELKDTPDIIRLQIHAFLRAKRSLQITLSFLTIRPLGVLGSSE